MESSFLRSHFARFKRHISNSLGAPSSSSSRMATAVASVSSPPMTAGTTTKHTDAADETRALQEANALLRRIGFGARQFARFEDLVASASSMSVTLYEKLFQLRLERVERAPRSLAHYEANAQLVLDALGAALLESPSQVSSGLTLDGVTGAALCGGDVHAIRQVVHMFEHVLSLLAAASAALQPARVKKTKKGARRAKKPMRVQMQRTSNSSDESAGERAPRLARRGTQRVGSRAPRHQEPERPPRGDVNLYETSDVSITRSRAGDVSSSRRRDVRPQSSPDAQTGGLSAEPTAHRPYGRDDSRDDRFQPESSANNRSRVMERSRGSDPLAETVRRKKSLAKASSSQEINGHTSGLQRHHGAPDAGATDPNLLETRTYGRFVPVALPSRSQRLSSAREDASSDGGEASDLDTGVHNANQGDGGEEPVYFGGVSSVSNGSGGEESVHFLDEGDGESRDFSNSNIVDLQNVLPANVNVSSSHSNAFDDRHQSTRSNHGTTNRKRAMQPPTRTKARKPNQEQEKEEDDDDEAEPARATTDELASSSRKAPPTTASAPPTRARGREKDPSVALYPLLPKKSVAASKSQAEFTRYKLYLKDHLQELRQVRPADV